jgi:hypothetical protein
MEVKAVEVYSEASNYGIVRLPGRHYPGCVIQGDSLAILFKKAKRAVRVAKDKGVEDEDLLGELEDLCDDLLDRLLHYQGVLQKEGFDLPYVRPLSREDGFRLMPEEGGEKGPHP